MRFRLYPTSGFWRIELMSATVTGAPNVTPPSNERATLITALVEGEAPALKVGPNCHTTYIAPLGPTAGAELCCRTPLLPQFRLVGSVTKVWSGLTTVGPCQLFPASCVRHASIWPKPFAGMLHVWVKFVSVTRPAPLPSLAVAIASLS